MLAPSRGDEEQLSTGLTLPSPTCADAAAAADRGRTLCGFSRRYVLLFTIALTISVVTIAASVGVVQFGLLSDNSNSNNNKAAVPSRGSSSADSAAGNNSTQNSTTTSDSKQQPSQNEGDQAQNTVPMTPAEVPVAPACTGFSCDDCSAPTAVSTGEGAWSLKSLGYGYAAQVCESDLPTFKSCEVLASCTAL